MKNIFKILLILFLSIIVNSCSKSEIEVVTSFPFEISENHQEAATVNIEELTNIEIRPEKIVSTNTYFIKYVINQGNGYYKNTNNEILGDNEWLTLDNLILDLNYVGTTIGEHIITISVKDNEGREEFIELNYQIENNPFTVNLNTVSNVATVDEPKDFNLVLSNTGDDESITYTASLFLSQGTGTIEIYNEEGELVEEVDQSESFEIEAGTYNYAVTLNDDGVNILEAVITDSNGQIISDEIEFAVDVINYTFTGEPEANTTSLGNDVNINFNLDEIDGGNASYEMRYVLTDGDADLFFSNNQIFAGTNIDVPLGAFTWVYTPTEIGTTTLTFIIVNSTGVEKEVQIQIEVQNSSFDFTATRALASTAIGGGIDINYVITEDGISEDNVYTMTYATSNNGILNINGQDFQPGTIITLTDLNFTATYFGTELGTHTIESTIKSSDNGVDVSKSINVEFTAAEFTFDVTTDVELTVGDTIDVEFLIQETIGESDLNISYTVSGPNQSLINSSGIELSSGTEYDVESNTFQWSLTAIEQGTVTITYTAYNQYDFDVPVAITYTILPVQFDFVLAANSNRKFTDSATIFSVDLSGQPTTLDYTLSIESVNLSIDEIYFEDNFNISENEEFEINRSFNDLIIVTSQEGVHNLEFTVTASNGVFVTKTLSIEYFKKISFDSFTYNGPSSGIFGSPSKSLTVNYTKDPNATLTNIVIDGESYNVTTSILDNSITLVYSCDRLSVRHPWECEGEDFPIIEDDSDIYLIDSNGSRSYTKSGDDSL